MSDNAKDINTVRTYIEWRKQAQAVLEAYLEGTPLDGKVSPTLIGQELEAAGATWTITGIDPETRTIHLHAKIPPDTDLVDLLIVKTPIA